MTTAFFVYGGRDRRRWGVSVLDRVVMPLLLLNYFRVSGF